MWKPSVIMMIVVFVVFGIALATAAMFERRRNRKVLGDERARGRNPDPDKGPDR